MQSMIEYLAVGNGDYEVRRVDERGQWAKLADLINGKLNVREITTIGEMESIVSFVRGLPDAEVREMERRQRGRAAEMAAKYPVKRVR